MSTEDQVDEFFLKISDIVSRKRQDEYGSPQRLHSMVADLWNAWVQGRGRVTSFDVPMMMIILKVCRLACAPSGADVDDTIMDIAGYAKIANDLSTTRL